MVFRRRKERTWLQWLAEGFWPRAGWRRVFEYTKHRVRRLPDTPERISRGVWAGVFVSFTPFFGLHFLFAAGIARLMRGNILASLIATFFGNPITFVPIGIISVHTGYFLQGERPPPHLVADIPGLFLRAGDDLWRNIVALFTPEPMHWSGLARFYDAIFLPYLLGGIIPGIVVSTIVYYLSLSLIRAYQNRRRNRLRDRLARLQKNPAAPGDGPRPPG